MSTFPRLKSGAVVQYGSQRTLSYSTSIVQFVDGTEQRYRLYAKCAHRWEIKLENLDDDELQRLFAFVDEMRGTVGLFSFTDPWDDTVYPSCSLATETTVAQLLGPMRSGTGLIVRENML